MALTPLAELEDFQWVDSDQDCCPHAARRTAAASSPLHRWVAAVALAGLALSSAALARTVNNCDIRVGTLCHGLNLSAAKLAGSDLSHADLSEADLHSANFRSVNLRGAILRDALMYDIDLERADLREADLRGANLVDSTLQDADLRGADLRGADLRGARIDASTDFGRATVEGCIGCPVVAVRKP